MRLEGKIAIITGAASGMGEAATGLFAREGAKVLAVDRPGTNLAQKHAGVDGVATFEQDIAIEDAGTKIVAKATSEFGVPNILFNNAGVSGSQRIEDISIAEWDRIFSVNIRGMMLLTQAVVPGMREQGWGRIVNVSSVAAIRPDFGLSTYAAAKAAVLGFTNTIALELGKFGITANAILPGPIYTGMTRNNFDNDYIKNVWERKTAMRRLGQPIDIANGALFLASDEASYITGHGLVIDGGQTLRM
ncbi:hypothetical protein AYO38_06645 [bacterium SCGC AG-212-C10]|nr:hypothetical protein AYO38_06645 [bacterium SCGC AG-212-C10]